MYTTWYEGMSKVGYGIRFLFFSGSRLIMRAYQAIAGLMYVLLEIQPCSARSAEYLLHVAQPRLRRGVMIRCHFPFSMGPLSAVI